MVNIKLILMMGGLTEDSIESVLLKFHLFGMTDDLTLNIIFNQHCVGVLSHDINKV